MTEEDFEKEETSEVLTPRQVNFAVLYGSIGSETYGMSEKSAVKAGYSEASARTAGWRLLRNRKVQEKIEGLRREQMSAVFVTTAKILADLEHTRLKALEKSDLMCSARCSQLQGEYLCMWTEKSAPPDGEELLTVRADEKARLRKIAEISLKE